MPLSTRLLRISAPLLLGLLLLLAAAPREAAAAPAANSADGLIFWSGCDSVIELTDAELDQWRARGVDGFVCMVGQLRGMGGSQDFTADPGASLAGENYSLQRRIRDSRIVDRAAARGMKMYLGLKLVNYYNHQTPLANWFDDSEWSGLVVPKAREFAGAARTLGFAGLAFDQELYPQKGGERNATWQWSFPGNTRTEAEVRAEARARGAQLMSGIVSAFPGVEIAAYDVRFPDTWIELVQREVNGIENAYDPRLDINFWDGLTSVDGYGAVRLYDSTFYKDSHRGTWDGALQYHQNQIYAYLSRNLSNWDYASSRLHVSPFSWINDGPCGCAWQNPRSPEYVAEQLEAFRVWGTGGEFANYANGPLQDFDYSPYVPAMREASTPAVVDRVAPRLSIDAGLGGPPPALRGGIEENLAVRRVVWKDNLGKTGVATLQWNILSGDYSEGYEGETRWNVPLTALSPGATSVEVTAEDIKGNLSPAMSAPVTGAGPTGPIGPGGGPAAGRAPQTKIVKSPAHRTHRRLARFRFRSDTAGGGFLCRIDGRRWVACNSGRSSYRLKRGRHRFQVRAISSAKTPDPSPAARRFRIKRR